MTVVTVSAIRPINIIDTKLDDTVNGQPPISIIDTKPTPDTDRVNLRRWLATIASFFFYYGMGLFFTALGVTLVHLSVVFTATTGSFAIVFSAQTAGALVGAIASAVLFERFACEAQLALALSVTATTAAVSAWSWDLYSFAVLRGVGYCAMGYVEAGINPYLLHTWKGSRLLAPVMQAKNLIFTVSCMLTPMMLLGLLDDVTIPPLANQTTLTLNFTLTSLESANNNLNLLIENASLVMSDNNETTTVMFTTPVAITNIAKAQWSYLIVGVWFAIPVIVWAAMCKFLPPATRLVKSVSVAKTTPCVNGDCNGCATSETKSKQRRMRIIFLSVMLVLMIVSSIALSAFLQYIPPLATLGLGWDVKMAAVLSTTVSIAVVAARLIATLTSAIISTPTLVGCSLTISSLGVVILLAMTLVVVPIDWMIWTGSFLVGFGLAPIIPSCYVWTNQVMGLSAVQSSMISAGMLTGFCVGPLVTSALSNTFGHMTMVYVVSVSCFVQNFAGIGLRFVAQKLQYLH